MGGLGAILLTLTGIGSIVPLILLWVFAFMRWPRDEMAGAGPWRIVAGSAGTPVACRRRRPPWPTGGLAAERRRRAARGALDGRPQPAYLLTGGAAQQANELAVPDPSVGQPHARLFGSGNRLGLEDLGTPGGTRIDGARLLPEHGPRDISAARASTSARSNWPCHGPDFLEWPEIGLLSTFPAGRVPRRRAPGGGN